MSRFAGVSMRAADAFYTTTLATHLHSESIAIRVKTGRMQSYGEQPNAIFPSSWLCTPRAPTDQTEYTVRAEKHIKQKDSQSKLVASRNPCLNSTADRF